MPSVYNDFIESEHAKKEDMNNEIINEYLELIAAYLANSTDANVDAVEAFEEAHPGVGDAAYQAGGPYEYDTVAGIVYTV